MAKPHVVIVGAGFGGTYVGRHLARYVKKGSIDVTIINKTNYFLFTPLLHEVATGSLSPMNAAESLREIFVRKKINIIQGMVTFIDTEKKIVDVEGSSIAYDILVVATGATTEYYGIPGAQEKTYPLKDLADAFRIKERVINCFEEEVKRGVCDKAMLTFTVVGGGPTGVETAAELAEFVSGIAKRYHKNDISCIQEDARVILVNAGTELLPQFDPFLRKVAEKRLRKEKIELYLGQAVAEVKDTSIILQDKTVIDTSTVIWAAGVSPSLPRFVQAPELMKGRLVVDEYFRVKGVRDVFALGDGAAYQEKGSDKPLPFLAQVAVEEAEVVGENIVRSVTGKTLERMEFVNKGALVSLGQWFGVGEIFSMHIYGKFAWWLWRTVYLFKFISWKKRVRIILEWTLNIFYPRDITKPI